MRIGEKQVHPVELLTVDFVGISDLRCFGDITDVDLFNSSLDRFEKQCLHFLREICSVKHPQNTNTNSDDRRDCDEASQIVR